MKKIIAILLVLSFTFSFVACEKKETAIGIQESTKKQEVSLTKKDKEKTNADIEFTQEKTFFNCSIFCPKDTSDKSYVRRTDLGFMFSYGSDQAVFAECPSDNLQISSVSSLEESIQHSEPHIFRTLESSIPNWFVIEKTKQTVEESKTVNINGNDALRVTGKFLNTRDNIEKDYIAYYFLATAYDGQKYPVYIFSIPLDGTTETMENFVDEMATHVLLK